MHNYTWNAEMLAQAEWIFLSESGMTTGAARHLPPSQQGDLAVGIMAENACATSEMHGEVLEYARVETAVRKTLGLTLGDRAAESPADGIAAMIVSARRHVSGALDRPLLERWREMIRSDDDCRPDHDGRPDVSSVRMRRRYRHATQRLEEAEKELNRFLLWFADHTGEGSSSPVTRAGLAHLWFESIHSFDGGNGRIGRALAEIALMRGLPTAQYTPLSPTLLKYRQEYYQMLDNSCRGTDITDWLLWFAAAIIEAGRERRAGVEFFIQTSRSLSSLRDSINSRQEKVLAHLYADGGKDGGGTLDLGGYRELTGADMGTALYELKELSRLQALLPDDGQSGRYRPAIARKNVARVRVADIL